MQLEYKPKKLQAVDMRITSDSQGLYKQHITGLESLLRKYGFYIEVNIATESSWSEHGTNNTKIVGLIPI